MSQQTTSTAPSRRAGQTADASGADRPDPIRQNPVPEGSSPTGQVPGQTKRPAGKASGHGDKKLRPPARSRRVKTSIRPSKRAALLFALSIPAAIFAVTFLRDVWYVSLYLPVAVLALIVLDASMALPGGRLRSELQIPPRLGVGQPGLVRLNLASNFGRPVRLESLLEYGELEQSESASEQGLEVLPEQAGEIEPPRPAMGIMNEESAKGRVTRGRLTLKMPVLPVRRGRLVLKTLWLRWRGPMGLVVLCRREPLNKPIDVVPDVRGIHETALKFFARDAVYGVKTQLLKGEGTEFDNLCDYSQGMDSRFIDWKRSARHRKLLCKEFRQERNHQIVFGFDTGHLMLEPVDRVPKLDHAIRAGLLLAWISLYSGDLVGGCGFDARMRNFIKPGRGMPYFTQFQRFSSSLLYRTEETNFTLGLTELNARLQRRALVILFTEFVDTISAELLLESLQLMLRRHVVIFVTMRDPMLARLSSAQPDNFTAVARAVIADDFNRERSIVLERITRMGVHCLDVPVREISSALLNRYLLIKQRGLL